MPNTAQPVNRYEQHMPTRCTHLAHIPPRAQKFVYLHTFVIVAILPKVPQNYTYMKEPPLHNLSHMIRYSIRAGANGISVSKATTVWWRWFQT